jgi:hypothetical protein
MLRFQAAGPLCDISEADIAGETQLVLLEAEHKR